MARKFIIILRDISDILDRSFVLYKRNFIYMIIVLSIVSLPFAIFYALFSNAVPRAKFIIDIIQAFFVYNLLGCAQVYVVGEIMRGKKIKILLIYRYVLRKCWKVIRITFFITLLCIPILLFLSLVMFLLLSFVFSREFTQNLSYMVITTIIIIITSRYYVVIPVVIFEDLQPLNAMRRSWSLSKSNTTLVVLSNFLSWLLTIPLISLPIIITALKYEFFGLVSFSNILNESSLYVVTQVGLTVTLPITYTVQVMVYYHLISRSEE